MISLSQDVVTQQVVFHDNWQLQLCVSLICFVEV